MPKMSNQLLIQALHEGDEKLHSDYINELPNLYGNDVEETGRTASRNF